MSDPSAPSPDGADPAMTSAMLKAMTHPIRREILRILRRREFVRAADVAEELGEPANKVSFHLRVLAEAGFLVEAPEHARDRRDRVWTETKRAFTVGGPSNPVRDSALGGAVIAAIAEDHQELVRRVLAWVPEYVSGRDDAVRGNLTREAVRLTRAEFEAMLVAMVGVVRAAEETRDPDAEDARIFEIDIIAADDTI